MNRLTYQKRDGNYSIRFDLGNLQQVDIKAMNKLGELEDIEEELGIDLITLFKALKNDFYFKYKDKIISSNDYLFQIRTNIRGNWIFDIISDNLSLLTIKIKDYGNTWWLSETKEE